jgi:hypothetical protein
MQYIMVVRLVSKFDPCGSLAHHGIQLLRHLLEYPAAYYRCWLFLERYCWSYIHTVRASKQGCRVIERPVDLQRFGIVSLSRPDLPTYGVWPIPYGLWQSMFQNWHAARPVEHVLWSSTSYVSVYIAFVKTGTIGRTNTVRVPDDLYLEHTNNTGRKKFNYNQCPGLLNIIISVLKYKPLSKVLAF